MIDEIDGKENPVITKIEDTEEQEDYGEQKVRITFFGLDKKIAEINASAGSGSGWAYGACVSVWCVESNKSETLASW